MAHTFERVDDTDWDWEILVALDFCEEELVLEEIGVGEVEFDLVVISLVRMRILLDLTHLLTYGHRVTTLFLGGKV